MIPFVHERLRSGEVVARGIVRLGHGHTDLATALRGVWVATNIAGSVPVAVTAEVQVGARRISIALPFLRPGRGQFWWPDSIPAIRVTGRRGGVLVERAKVAGVLDY